LVLLTDAIEKAGYTGKVRGVLVIIFHCRIWISTCTDQKIIKNNGAD
jgi:hypothetical protein